jgi:hypothetical protein
MNVVRDILDLKRRLNRINDLVRMSSSGGTPGQSAYVYIAYASDDSGTDFTLTFDPELDWIAIKNTTTAIPSPQVSDFAGLWKNYGGGGGGGDSAYVYIAYASDDSGTDFTLTFDSKLNYIAILSTDTEIPSPIVDDFAGLWKNYKGADGADGAPGAQGPAGADGADGQSAYVYIAYASDDKGTDFTLTFDPNLDYIAILSTTTEIPTPKVDDFSGLWKNYKGADGADGADGTSVIVYISEDTPSGGNDGEFWAKYEPSP